MFTACSNTAVNTPSSEETPSDTTQSTDDVLKVGIDLKFYPFMYLDDNGEPTGFEVDIAYAFGEYIGREIEIVNTDFSMIIPALDTGEIDIAISDMSATVERELKADFSKPYRYAPVLALVNKEFALANNIDDTMSEEDFYSVEGMKFIGLSGTVAVSLPREKGLDVVEATDIAAALVEVTQGMSHVHMGAGTVYGDHAAHPETTIVYSNISDYFSSSFAVKNGNQELIDLSNEFIDWMYTEEGLYTQAGDKYDQQIGEFLSNPELGLDFIIYPPSSEN